MKFIFTERAWSEYLHWQESSPATVRKIHALLRDASRTPFEGLGQPEPLKHAYAGFWSRRISQEHRMVYRLVDDAIEIVQLRSHYQD